MSRRRQWEAEVVAIHERVAKAWEPWSRLDREQLLPKIAAQAGKLAQARGAGDDATVREEIGDMAVYLALVAHAWSGVLPVEGRCEAALLIGRGGTVTRKFLRGVAMLVLGMDDTIAATRPESGTVIVPGMVSATLGTLEMLAEIYDATVEDCVDAVLPKIRAKFPAPSDVAA